jgi:hypothetical protein
MSLLASASPWQNDGPPKKRVSTIVEKGSDTMRKTIKLRPSFETENLGNNGIAETQAANENTNTKITALLNKITGFSESDKMGDFNPPPNPEVIFKKTVPSAEGTIPMPENPLIPKMTNPMGQSVADQGVADQSRPATGYYKPSEPRTYSNYSQVYPSTITEPRGVAGSPYYAKMGVGLGQDKFMEKINYMVHLLEEQQLERTNHVTEEFILYSLLGVFMIYLVDGFSRTGKYVR